MSLYCRQSNTMTQHMIYGNSYNDYLDADRKCEIIAIDR